MIGKIKMFANEKIHCAIGFLILAIPAIPARSQTLEHIGSFWGFTDVQFLPGGYVLKDDEGEKAYYFFQNSKFDPFSGKLPPLIQNWSAYDGTIDSLDQMDGTAVLDRDLQVLLPKRAKVKKHFEFEMAGGKADLALICYTRQLTIEGSNTQDIFLLAALNTNRHKTPFEYRKVWVRKLASESNYGDFQFQRLADGTALLLFYSADIGGDAIGHQLDIYRIKMLDKTKQRPPGHGVGRTELNRH